MCPERTQRPRRPGRPRGTRGLRYPRGPTHTDTPLTRCYHNKELITTELSSTTLVLGGQGPRGPEAQRPRGPEAQRPRDPERGPQTRNCAQFFHNILKKKTKLCSRCILTIFFPTYNYLQEEVTKNGINSGLSKLLAKRRIFHKTVNQSLFY